MSLGLLALLFGLGCVGGLLSGFLGIGGAVVMIPLLNSVPQAVGLPGLSMQAISGLSIVQVLFASLSGLLVHRRNRLIDGEALLLMGLSMVAGSLAGVAASTRVSGHALLIVFGVVAILALVVMALPSPPPREAADRRLGHRLAMALIGAAVGLLSGLVGAGGGFILLPLLVAVVRLPLSVAVGTSLGIVFLGSIVGSVGKTLAGQVDILPALALVLGAVPLARLGAALSKKAPPGLVKALLVLAILASTLQTWLKILSPRP